MNSPNKKKHEDDDDDEIYRKKKKLKKITNLFDDDEEEETLSKEKNVDNIQNKNEVNDNKVKVKDVDDYFSKLQNDKKIKLESLNRNIKKERIEKQNENDSPNQINSKNKKLKIETKNDIDLNTNQFDYLCFNNQKFVITGVFKNYTRDELITKIKELGGNVLSAVSSKTNFLIHGEFLEDGRLYTEGNKYKKAKTLLEQKKSNIQILNEDDFIKLIPNENMNETVNGNMNEIMNETINENMNETMNEDIKGDIEQDIKQNINENKENIKNSNRLWVEKYRPRDISELVGNNANIIKLKNWLESWADVCIKGNKKEIKKSFRGNFENVNAKSALLSGFAGIGKTTCAKLIAEETGYNVIEFNASDERNKNSVEKISEMTSGGYTLNHINNKLKKTCIIMDEIDGMSSGDKGGINAILKLIDKSKCPIICICNDRQNPKIRTLANKCYDLKFYQPQKNQVIKRISNICAKENLFIEPNAIDLLCESTQCDLRQILNILQLLSKTYKKINYLDIKKELSNSNKNLLTLSSPFEITIKILNFHESSKLKIRDLMDLFFIDYELIPFFITENYANVFNDNDKSNILQKWNTYQKIANDLSLADKVKYNLKTNMDFSLLPHFCILSCVCPSLRIKLLKSYMHGRINFPSSFGKISTFNKNKRLLNELCFALSYKLNVSPKILVTSGFLNYIYFKLINPLQNNKPEETLKIMEHYNITKEMLIEHLPCLRLSKQQNLYDKLDSKVKASFTRMYNNSHTIKNDPNLFKKGANQMESLKLKDELNELSDEELDSSDTNKKEKDLDPLIKMNTKKVTTKSKTISKASPKSKASPRSKKK